MNENNHNLGKFCSVAKKGTIIMPKKIPGYKEPAGQILKENCQKIIFKYTPIIYSIDYNLSGGKFVNNTEKYKYTVEDNEYIPEIPVRDGYSFKEWRPKSIPKGHIGDVKFTAIWTPNAILLPGKELNDKINKISKNKENIIRIQRVDSIDPDTEVVNISCTTSIILAYFDKNTLYIYSPYEIHCNKNMDSAFENLTLLTDIGCLEDFICDEYTSIRNIFKNCKLLSNTYPVENWANGIFSNFTNAFENTSALKSLITPNWYKWKIVVNYESSTGNMKFTNKCEAVPGQTIYQKKMLGYENVTKSLEINSPDIEYTFQYVPIEYDIKYNLDGGELIAKKEKYTIEDDTYYPPNPVKYGYNFIGWDNECIHKGDVGNVTFNASYEYIK